MANVRFKNMSCSPIPTQVLISKSQMLSTSLWGIVSVYALRHPREWYMSVVNSGATTATNVREPFFLAEVSITPLLVHYKIVLHYEETLISNNFFIQHCSWRWTRPKANLLPIMGAKCRYNQLNCVQMHKASGTLARVQSLFILRTIKTQSGTYSIPVTYCCV